MSSNKKKIEPFKTVLVITVGFLVVYLITKSHWSLYISLAVGILGLLSNYLAIKIEFLWMKLTWVLGLIVPNILLTIFFYVFLTPIAFLSRLIGEKNQLSLKNINSTLFKERNKTFDKQSFEKPW
jgi:saxitoxin biosynthesis operon SxtJ-like protein